MLDWYQHWVVDTGRAGLIWMLISFAVTFVITRSVTRSIRARGANEDADAAPAGDDPGSRGVVKDVHIGGVHIHHQVWGILLILIVAVLEFAYQPSSPWIEVLGALFGAGAALTLDEFALWLHLDDVYWSTEGRKSIDAVVVAVCIIGALLLGSTPFGVADAENGSDAAIGIPVTILMNGAVIIICMMKGKLITGLIGVFVPVVALFGAIRLAKPGSMWAKRRYPRRPARLERATRKAERAERRMDRIRDVLGGRAGAEGGNT